MWSAILGYPGPVAVALMQRLVVLLVAGPWLVLLAAFAPRLRPRFGVAVRAALVLVVFDRLMADFRMWAPMAVIVVAVSLMGAVRQASSRPHRLALAVWLSAGLILMVLSVNLGPVGPVRFAVLFFVASSLLGEWPREVRLSGEGGIGRAAICATATIPLYWSIPEFNRGVFLQMLLAGVAGWVGLQFLCWRAKREQHGRHPFLRVASWMCGLTGGVLFSVLAAELYFRYVYDATDANTDLRTAQHWMTRHVQLNSWGYRDREVPPQEELERLTRIVLLGDSFAFGWGIDEYADLSGPRLERVLAGRMMPAPRVFTLAICGLDTRREMEVFRRDGVRLRPQVVVLMYHLNDTDTLLPWPWRRWKAAPVWWPLIDSSDFLEFFLWHASVRGTAARRGVKDLPGMAAYQDPALFARQSKDLLILIDLVREAGALPVVSLYPYLDAPTREGPQRDALNRIGAVLAEAGVPVIDISRLVDVNDRRFHANPFDPHPSPALHAAVMPTLAEAVLSVLRGPATSPAGQ